MDTQSGVSVRPTPPAQPSDPQTVQNGWIGWSLVAGVATALPIGYLLGYLAALPFLLGLFFFLLLGLMVGAMMFRFGSRAARPANPVLWVMGTAVAMILMLTSLWAEYRALPTSVASLASHRRAELEAGVRDYTSAYLAKEYPPGGFLGYLQWAARDGELTYPRALKLSNAPYRLPYRRVLWLVRVILSMLLVEWTILAQLVAMRSEPPMPASGETPSADATD